MEHTDFRLVVIIREFFNKYSIVAKSIMGTSIHSKYINIIRKSFTRSRNCLIYR